MSESPPSNRLVSLRLRVTLPPTLWRLLRQWVVVLNYKRLQQGYPPLTLNQWLSTVLAHYCINLAQVIQEKTDELRLELEQQDIPEHFTVEHLDEIASASAEEGPGLLHPKGYPTAARTQGYLKQTKRAFRRINRLTRRDVARHPRLPK